MTGQHTPADERCARFSCADFLAAPAGEIRDRIVEFVGARLRFDARPTQLLAWSEEVRLLAAALSAIPAATLADWTVLFEYEVPRIGCRPDVVLLTRHTVIVIEFKVGATYALAGDAAQLRSYLRDLRDYHAASAGISVRGTLIPTDISVEAASKASGRHFGLTICSPARLAAHLAAIAADDELSTRPRIDHDRWIHSEFKRTPTIVQAAQDMFERSRRTDQPIGDPRPYIHYAGIEKTKFVELVELLVSIVTEAQRSEERHAVFITGVPGSGKTLAGLSLVFEPGLHRAMGSQIFVTGNRPLLRVLEGAFGRDAGHEFRGAVQGVHRYIDDATGGAGENPRSEHVVVFDEAQRAWSAEHLAATRRRARRARHALPEGWSEPDLMIDALSRVPRWAVLVALIGNGQEIWTGEAGLPAWGAALNRSTADWVVHGSAECLGSSEAGRRLFANHPPGTNVEWRAQEVLHLDKSLRTVGSLAHNEWVDALLRRDIIAAAQIRRSVPVDRAFEVYVTRSIDDARSFVRRRAGDNESFGLVASFHAQLLRRIGLELSKSFRDGFFKEAHWFNKTGDDARSSRQLQVAATQIECQGLDLDHVILVWGDDFLPAPSNRWEHRKTKGGGMSLDRPSHNQRNRENGYRVLLTRARKSLTIVVPPPPNERISGCVDIASRLDGLHELLTDAGVPILVPEITS